MRRDSLLTIQELKVRAVRVPMIEPHQTASGVITESPLVLTDVMTNVGAAVTVWYSFTRLPLSNQLPS